MATYSLTGGGVAYQDVDSNVPDFDYIEHLRRLGYPDEHIRSQLRRQGYGDAEITGAMNRPSQIVQPEDRFARGMFGPDPGGQGGQTARADIGKAAVGGHPEQQLAERGAMRALTGKVPTATAEQWQQYMDRVAGGQLPPEFESGFLGGLPSDFVYRTETPDTIHQGPSPDALNIAGGRGLMSKTEGVTAYSRPTYREGSAYSYMSSIGQEKMREWQSFFAGLGFQTGPAGVMNKRDIENMQAFMGMANGIPGGMTVDLLRGQVMDQVRQGIYFFRGVNEEGDLLPILLDEEPAGDLTAGAGGAAPGAGGTEPITQTMTRTINQEISADQGMLALRRVFQQQRGRMPNEEEIKELVRQVNAAFRADPTVITQTTTFDPVTQTETSETVEDESNVSVEGQAESFATQDDPERKTHLANQFMNAIASELGM